ncbi:MAG: epoxyqueuosine reductase QueH [Clostridiales bacterium]|nr:epoxyqueuosine reductase QueH [Clostridiales bacterium]
MEQQENKEKKEKKGNAENYQKKLERILLQLEKKGEVPSLLLHSCCAPCSSYVLEYLHHYFRITVFYYNPNITKQEEYAKRAAEQIRFVRELNRKEEGYPIEVVEGSYEPQRFLHISKGMEQCPEGGERCFACYALRLGETAKQAAERKADYFTTTLTISPLKNAVKLNEIGMNLAEQFGVRWLPSDFKKKNGYKRSIELSAEYGLYRQNYCGCVFSKRENLTEIG